MVYKRSTVPWRLRPYINTKLKWRQIRIVGQNQSAIESYLCIHIIIIFISV